MRPWCRYLTKMHKIIEQKWYFSNNYTIFVCGVGLNQF